MQCWLHLVSVSRSVYLYDVDISWNPDFTLTARWSRVQEVAALMTVPLNNDILASTLHLELEEERKKVHSRQQEETSRS